MKFYAPYEMPAQIELKTIAVTTDGIGKVISKKVIKGYILAILDPITGCTGASLLIPETLLNIKDSIKVNCIFVHDDGKTEIWNITDLVLTSRLRKRKNDDSTNIVAPAI